MIPKIIHYCWFGGNPLPKTAEKCITSWKKYCPEYELLLWNEQSFDLTQAPLYVQQAYAAERWAFVTDYVRLKVVHDYGGLYLDTDVELLRSPDPFLIESAFFGFEGTQYINTGLGFGAEKGAPILKNLLNEYMQIPFLLENGLPDLTPCPKRNTEVFFHLGLQRDGSCQRLEDGTRILSAEYLCPLDNATRILNTTGNTLSIHHFDGSWQDLAVRRAHDRLALRRRIRLHAEEVLYYPRKQLRRFLGDSKYEVLKAAIKGGVFQ